jgi:tetratricopeptide (TPR) repeat protein
MNKILLALILAAGLQADFEPEEESAASQVAVAKSAIEKKDWDGAQTALDKAESIEAGNKQIKIYRGALQLAKKEYGDAVKTLEEAVEAAPDEPYGHYYLGLAHYGMKHPDKTVEHFQRFLALAPDAPEAARVRSLLRSLR